MQHPSEQTTSQKPPWIFFFLVFILSVPFWLVNALVKGFQEQLPIALPISALQFVVPVIVASLLVYREQGWQGVKELLKRAVDFKRIKNKIWYVPILLLWPAMTVIAYGLMYLTGAPLPEHPQFSILLGLVFLAVFFFSVACEQIGFMGYAIDPLQARWKALGASVIMGSVWAVWHVIPFMQIPQPPSWILWQCLGMIPFRILIVWLYNNTGRSVFATIVFQATANLSQFLFPNNGSHYDPFFAFLVLAFTAGVDIVLWGPETLTRYRFARLRRIDVQH